MTTDEIIETFIQEGVTAYKKNYKNTQLYTKLSRHEPLLIDGITFNYWRELSVYKTGQLIREIFPNIDVEISLEGNDSSIKLELSDDDLRKLTTHFYAFLKKYDCL